ncbi:hypothetical protein MJO29_002818 [Puccinia striiformis f. sp. tritici]|nr:hypothetical protein MJO29_002818 [Puccinia striiformis f. sp. tritici]
MAKRYPYGGTRHPPVGGSRVRTIKRPIVVDQALALYRHSKPQNSLAMAGGRKRTRQKSPSPSPSPSPSQPPDSNLDLPTEPSDTRTQPAGSVDETGPLELNDDEQLLRAQRIAANAVSKAYLSYHTPQLSKQKDKRGRLMIAYPCKMPALDSSCSNLLKHAAGCINKQREVATNQKLVDLGVSGTGDIDLREVPQLCAIWCAEAARPFSALKDQSHKNILHPTVVKNLPSSKVVSRSIHMLYTAVQDSYREVLKKHTGAMYLGADAWQAPNGFDILGIVIYRLIENNGGQFELEAMPLDFIRLAKSHTGKYLAETVCLVLEKFNVQNKICGIVTDNASNNSYMVAEMKKYKWTRFKGEPQWIRCFAHILNLIAQSILSPFGTLKKKKATGNRTNNDLDSSDDSEEDEEEAVAQICRYEDDTGISEEEEDEHTSDDYEAEESGEEEAELTLSDLEDLSDEDEENDLYTSAMCKQSLAKFRAIARKLRKSPNSKAEFVELCKELECQRPHSIERDVRTRWNSTWAQIKSIIRCEKAIMIWQKDKKHGVPRKYYIDVADIELARQLVSILQLFYEQTLQISKRGSARLSHIIVYIDEITDLLSNAIKGEDNEYPPALRNACRVGLRLTNKYYTLTDCSPLFRIAMVLHPSFKDQYFKIAGWENEWIMEALRLTREMFDTFYKPQLESLESPSSSQPSKPSRPRTGTIAQLGAALAARSGPSSTDPLDTWLASSVILDDGAPINALKWWMNQKRAGNTHGGLLKMALDVLSCPATSVDVERAFSFGRDYVSAKRHRLSPQSVSQGMSVAFYSKNNLIRPGTLYKWKEGRKEDRKRQRKEKKK